MKITLVGGGNVGLSLAVLLKNKNHDVTIYTTKKDKWNCELECIDEDTNTIHKAKIDRITDNINNTIDSDLFIFTVPPFVAKKILDEISPKLTENQILFFYPGYGGMEYALKNVNAIVAGTQRISCVARLNEYGHSTTIKGKRKELFLGCIPGTKGEEVCRLMEELLDIKINLLPNYFNVTMVPSNPILHTSRLYNLFSNFDYNQGWDVEKKFYGDWNLETSELLIAMNDELNAILSKLSLDTSYVRPLLEHYESTDAQSLTNKIRSIKSLNNLGSPVIKKNDKYYPDLESRYFVSDFPYGLLIIKSIGLLVDVETPNIDKVIEWYQEISNKKYIVNNELGEDSKELLIPQNYEIDSPKKLVKFYDRNR